MVDSIALLQVARDLSNGYGRLRPTDAQLRRAVSTAYYALFHKVIGAAALRFMGEGQEETAGYSVLYRCFEHSHMSSVCEALQVQTLKEKYRRIFGKDCLSQHARDFAGSFPALQQARHLADYDPKIRFLPSDVSSLVDTADVSIAAFDQIDASEQSDMLALLMVKMRA